MSTRQIQLLLTYLGYSPGEIDGAMGANTTAAIKAFQSTEGLTVDGIAGELTTQALKNAVANDRFYAPKSDTAAGDFWSEIRYFRRDEFRCQCKGKYCDGFPAEPAEETVRMADEIRRRAGVPLNVNSGLRCETWNAMQGGVTTSLHRTGRAVDLSGNISQDKLKAIAEEVTAEMIPGRGGIGLYKWGIHVDNGQKSRWNG